MAIPLKNIEELEAPKATSHDPYGELREFYERTMPFSVVTDNLGALKKTVYFKTTNF